jgi:hypothetical protein
VLDDRRGPKGFGFVVMADPEGNEFCLEMGPTERAALQTLRDAGEAW